ncbi:glutamyl-tRNA reductase [Chondrinema litorale]|uniref:glutamyl-tRNA reductase n=1 Tax=Chondrinema litorale TaxID=2994555 RepID=UPI002542CBA2|nr:glutamyl-tRNA reductase [Chondrinema litorale]UZR96560.1 glutamyl-tRNA reductase [Chondrinema litorale]
MTNFFAFGISHKKTPVEIRGILSFDESTCKEFLFKCKEHFGISEMLVISTCNRFEIYYSGEESQCEKLIKFLCVFKNISFEGINSHFNFYNTEKAIQHLFKVAIGLDAKVLGDLQIINQVKRAYQWSADEDMAGPFLHRLLHTIFFTNKRVVQETEFRKGTASLASVSSELVKKFINRIANSKVVLIGVGEIGVDVAKNLSKTNAQVTILNRTKSKAVSIAKTYGYKVKSFDALDEIIQYSDVIISTVRIEKTIIDKDSFQQITKPKLLIDLSVPCSIHNNVTEHMAIHHYNVDQLESKTCNTIEKRKQSIPQVESIIADSVMEFKKWTQEMTFSPVIKKFKKALETIRQEEIAHYIKKMNDNETEVMNTLTKSIMQKVIKLPVLQLKAACSRGNAHELADILHELFDLEK